MIARNDGPTLEMLSHDFDYPRPQLRRPEWTSLNGPWRFALDDSGVFRERAPRGDEWALTIEVPFAPESEKSGVHDTGFHRGCWYEREVDVAPPDDDQRVFLHFGAVDYDAKVWVNGQLVGSHQGGHTPFCFEITAVLRAGGRQTITVHAEDDPFDLAKPRGKQDWELLPHSIWYPRTTGIWQGVWLERTAASYVERVRWTPHLERWELACEIFLGGTPRDDLQIRLTLFTRDQILAEDTYSVIAGEVHRSIALSDPGIDDFRNKLLWSPDCPNLIEARIELRDRTGKVLDAVLSYTALRSVGTERDRFMLNGRPYYLRLVLDQGYWPDTLLTPPSVAALRRDIELVKAMGFNGVRKHQKIEDPRFLHLADRMGLVVWEEMPSAYRFTHTGVERLLREWNEVIDRDFGHPCIVAWVPFNESWGVPDLPEKLAHQHCVQAMYHLTRTLDPMRPVIGNDGWEAVTTDILGIHDYDGSAKRIRERYGPNADVADLLGRRRPGGRLLTLEDYPSKGQPIMLTEFGGIAIKASGSDPAVWGYTISEHAGELERKYKALLRSVNETELFAGFCYTQLTDTFQEANGLLTADRRPKFPLDRICHATHGSLESPDDVLHSPFELGPRDGDLPAVPQHPQIPRGV
jgi:beta-galactosidase/beta-glucuronidase